MEQVQGNCSGYNLCCIQMLIYDDAEDILATVSLQSEPILMSHGHMPVAKTLCLSYDCGLVENLARAFTLQDWSEIIEKGIHLVLRKQAGHFSCHDELIYVL